MHIESGPTRERRVRNGLMLCMVAAFSLWFAYDGFVGYAKKNFEEHLKQLDAEDRDAAADAPVYDTVVAGSGKAANEALRKFDKAAQRAELEAIFGGPPSVETDKAWYYFGPAFRIKISLESGRLQKVNGVDSSKTETDILMQKGLAAGLGVFAIVLVVHIIRVVRTHLVLDDSGLTHQGIGPISWDDMKALDTEQFEKKGWVDLVYDQQGEERFIRLDEYHLANFDEVIDALCERKGFKNPLPVNRDADASHAADSAQGQPRAEAEHVEGSPDA